MYQTGNNVLFITVCVRSMLEHESCKVFAALVYIFLFNFLSFVVFFRNQDQYRFFNDHLLDTCHTCNHGL